MINQRMKLWISRIEKLNTSIQPTSFNGSREVWNCQLGINVGHEQNGDLNSFIRPVLVIQQFGPHMLWVVPLSTKTPPNSPHHHVFEHDGNKYSALITQFRAIDLRRLTRKAYTLDRANYYEIQLHLARMLLRQQNRTPD